MRETLRAYCERTQQNSLLAQWDIQRNVPLTPETLSHGSKRKVWWRCGKGHSWQAAVYARTAGAGCPVCAGKQPLPGQTDLATRYPVLAAQWHPSRNGTLMPSDVLPGSHRMVWWMCRKGHAWCAQVKSRVAGSGCPVCTGRKVLSGENDLQTRFPVIAAQWHPTGNGTLTARDVSPGSKRKVWWLCEKGHAWQAAVAARTANGSGCPICTGKQVLPGENDLQSRFPDIAAQWHPTKNGMLHPEMVAAYANRKVWWLCEKGHTYYAVVAARTVHGSGCPYCAGRKVWPGFNDLATLAPEVAAQWHPTRNGALKPQMVTVGAHKKVWWKCSEGHVWQAMIFSRTGEKKCGCPVCAGRRPLGRQTESPRSFSQEKWEDSFTGQPSLLEHLATQMGCVCVSDLRRLTGEKRRRMADELVVMMPRQQNLREWLDAVSYLIGAVPERTTCGPPCDTTETDHGLIQNEQNERAR